MALDYNYPYSSPSSQEFTDVINTGLMTTPVAALNLSAGVLRTVPARAADLPSVFEYIPATYHAAITAFTGTPGTYDVGSAINAAVADSRCNGLQFPRGLYNVASMATINKPFRLQGQHGTYATPAGSVIRVAQDIVGIKVASGSHIANLVFDGSVGGPTYDCKGGVGLWFSGGNLSVVKHCIGCYFRLTPFYLDGVQNSEFSNVGGYYNVYNFLMNGITRTIKLSLVSLSNLAAFDPAYVTSQNPGTRNLFVGHLADTSYLATLGITQLADGTITNYPSNILIDGRSIFERMTLSDANIEVRGFYDQIVIEDTEITDAIATGFLLKASQVAAGATGTIVLRRPSLKTGAAVGSRPEFVSAGAGVTVQVEGPVVTNIQKPVRGPNIRAAYQPGDIPPYRHALASTAHLTSDAGGWVIQPGATTSVVAYNATTQALDLTLQGTATGVQCAGGSIFANSNEFTTKLNLRGRIKGYCTAVSASVNVYVTRTDTPFQVLVGTITTTGEFTIDYVVAAGTYDGGVRLLCTTGTLVTLSLTHFTNGWLI